MGRGLDVIQVRRRKWGRGLTEYRYVGDERGVVCGTAESDAGL